MSLKRSQPTETERKLNETIEGDHAAKKSRNQNWTLDEKIRLVNAIKPHYKIVCFLKGSKARKERLWDKILEKVNASNVAVRDKEQIKTKWANLEDRTHEKASTLFYARRKSKGYPDIGNVENTLRGVIEPYEMKIVKMMGVLWLLGIRGGIDSGDYNMDHTCTEADYDSEDQIGSPGDGSAPTNIEEMDLTKNMNKETSQSNLEVGASLLMIQSKLLEAVERLAGHTADISSSLKELVTLKKIQSNGDPNYGLIGLI